MADLSETRVRTRRQAGLNLLLLLLAGSYFIWTVVNHQRIGSLLANTYNINDPASYNLVFLQFGVLFLGTYLAATIPFYVRSKRYLALGYLLLAITLTAACVPWLIVVNSEMIHFAQYALLGVLLFPLIRSYWLTVVVGTLLGAIDEGMQYWVWTPDMHYFDFNDVLFNLLGTVLGVLLIGAWIGRYSPGRPQWHTGWLIIGSIILLAALGWLTQWLDIYPDPTNPAPVQLIREAEKEFWTVLPPHRRFHVLRPGSGAAVILLMLTVFMGLDRAISRSVD
jgi:hypothetical protein